MMISKFHPVKLTLHPGAIYFQHSPHIARYILSLRSCISDFFRYDVICDAITMATITVKPNYFTCTLGHAAQSKEQDGHLDHEFGTVMQLIDGNCRRSPQAPALGFADYASTPHKAHGNLIDQPSP